MVKLNVAGHDFKAKIRSRTKPPQPSSCCVVPLLLQPDVPVRYPQTFKMAVHGRDRTMRDKFRVFIQRVNETDGQPVDNSPEDAARWDTDAGSSDNFEPGSLKLKDNYDATYTVAFELSDPGQYVINILTEEHMHIKGSPVPIAVAKPDLVKVAAAWDKALQLRVKAEEKSSKRQAGRDAKKAAHSSTFGRIAAALDRATSAASTERQHQKQLAQQVL